MPDFEKLGVFYLGRPYDLNRKERKRGWLLYDSKDLVTHAVCVGMTGSGKTGLCIGLLEEAAIDGIPAIVIDPKGDLGNLLLTFPQLRGEDFAPWINEDEAKKQGVSPAVYAAQQAERWKVGLHEWGQDGERIARLRQAAEFAIYTPGSTAGRPVSILSSFAAPAGQGREDLELLRERIGTTVTSLLSLVGIDADPVQSRDHILISRIFHTAWTKGQDLDLAGLIHAIQSPPVDKIGVVDLETFYPSKERFKLAMTLNNLLAAPGFEAWLEGETLEVGRLLYTAQGKPRVAIFSIAHLNDAERMFFVSMLLTQVVGWMRTQSGTTSLRALLYMDEIFGYFPPVANPPSKAPLLTLLKQARAFGVGVVLATQNPVDLDYKGLANTGTWFIGRLQTERDKARVMEGLEGAAATAGTTFDRSRMEQVLAGLGSRIFLMHNVHESEPVLFETRWTLSYLRGPLTRTQIKQLTDPVRGTGFEVRGRKEGPSVSAPPSALSPQSSVLTGRPVLPPAIRQYFIPVRGSRPEGGVLVYQPMVLGVARIHVSDAKARVDVTQELAFLTSIGEGAVAVDWDQAVEMREAVTDLSATPEGRAQFASLPQAALQAGSYQTWEREFAAWLFRTQKVSLFRSPTLKMTSEAGESEREFRIRMQQRVHEQRDSVAEKLRQTYAPKRAALEERLRRARQAKEREAEQAKQQYVQTAISVGATILDAFLGRKTVSRTTVGKATTAARSAGRAIKESGDIARATENEDAVRKQIESLETQFQADLERLSSAGDSLTEPLEPVAIRPTKTNISVTLLGLGWVPEWRR